MLWLITLSGSKRDADLLAAEGFDGLSLGDEPGQLVLELHDPEGDATGGDAPHAAKAVLDAIVRNLNGVGKLRWGRTFGGVSVATVRSFDPSGAETQRVFVGPAIDHMLPEDFADMVQRLGHPRPELPSGWDVIKALDLVAVTALIEEKPDVGRVLHLVELMLEGDDEIDWAAGYAALEIIEQDLKARQLKGQDLGWWTGAERKRFTATANSPEALGFRARHGKNSGVTEARMNSKEASWFVRRAAALWLTQQLADTDGQPGWASRGRWVSICWASRSISSNCPN